MIQHKSVLIIEDEAYAAKNLVRKLKTLRPEWEILAICQSVQDSLETLRSDTNPDIIFSDIELTDGLSFDVFKEINLLIPVIFTTAYSQYALEAFQQKGFAYLLKPIDIHQLEDHIQRIEHLQSKANISKDLQSVLKQLTDQQEPQTKNRFLIKKGDKYYTLSIETIRLIIFDELAWAIDTQGHRHPLDYSLNQLEDLLDSQLFFRINRQAILHRDNLIHASQHFNGRLKLALHNQPTNELFVSRDRVGDFKVWMEE